jgi:hypothetical protein
MCERVPSDLHSRDVHLRIILSISHDYTRELTGTGLSDVDGDWEGKPFYPTFADWAKEHYSKPSSHTITQHLP